MKIKNLIKQLKEVKRDFGNMSVFISSDYEGLSKLDSRLKIKTIRNKKGKYKHILSLKKR